MWHTNIVSLALAVGMLAPWMWGQTGGGGVQAVPGRKGSPPTNPDRTEQRNQPFFISGRVMIDDGSEPPVGIVIERVCNGRPRREGRTTADGVFSFYLGHSIDAFQDASIGSSPDAFSRTTRQSASPDQSTSMTNERELMSCELRAVLAGYRSDMISLAGRRFLDNPDIGTIFLHRVGRVEGTVVSMTSLQAPKAAKKALEHGRKELANKRPDKAAEEFRKALELHPKYAEAMVSLGELYAHQGRKEEAQKLLEAAVAADAKFIPPYFTLAVLAAQQQDWERVASLTDQILALNAYEYPAAYYYNAAANFRLANLEKAEKSARSGRRLDSQHRIPDLDLVLASVLLRRNDYTGAADQMKTFLKYVQSGPDAERVRGQLAQIETMAAPAKPPAAAQGAPK